MVAAAQYGGARRALCAGGGAGGGASAGAQQNKATPTAGGTSKLRKLVKEYGAVVRMNEEMHARTNDPVQHILMPLARAG